MLKNLMRSNSRLALLFAVAVGVVSVHAQERKIPVASTPIRERIRSDDRVLTIVGATSPALGVVYPPDADLLELLLDRHNLVMLLRVDDRKTHLTRTENWLQTTVTGTVATVFKADPSWAAVRPGSRISFLEEGGTIVLGNVTVHGVESFRRPTTVGSRYLVFTEFLKNTGFVLLPDTTYELVGPGGLPKKVASTASGSDQIERSYEADIVAKISRYLTSKQ